MGSGGWQQQKCTHPFHPCHPPLQPTLPSLKRYAHVIHDQTCAAQVVGQHNDGSSARGTWAARANWHLLSLIICPLSALKRIWGPSILLGFWDHPPGPRTTAWGKPVKVTHRPSAPHSRAPSWTTGHHWVPPAVERLARKVGPKVLAPWSLFGPKEPNAPRAVPLFHTKCGGPGWQTPTPTGALSVPIVGETHLGQGKVGIARVTGWKGCGT